LAQGTALPGPRPVSPAVPFSRGLLCGHRRRAPPAPRSSGPPFVPGQRRLMGRAERVFWRRGLPARPIGGPDRGRSIMATRPRRRRRPTMVPAAISLAPTAPALPRGKPQGLVRSPSVWRSIESLGGKRGHPKANESWGSLPRSWGVSGDRPSVALMPRWRQDYLNNRPPTRAAAISEMATC
jgi:hypothetical protein